jgi:transcriptional regulator with XRE-family HTH domain
MQKKVKSHRANALFRLRRKSHFERKQVASLLGQKTGDSISAYERGTRDPDLATGLRLAIIYNCTFEEMFPEHIAAFRDELSVKIGRIPRPHPSTVTLVKEGEAQLACGYESLMAQLNHSQTAMEIARDHVTKLARRLAGL